MVSMVYQTTAWVNQPILGEIEFFIDTEQGRNMVYGLRAQSPKYDWDQGSEQRAQGSEEWDQGSQGF